MMTVNRPDPVTALTTLVVGAFAMVGLLLAWWTYRPANLPDVVQPLPILNPGRQVAIGDPIRVELTIVKTVPRQAVGSVRYLACETGNLVTLTSTASQLPVGEYRIVSDNVILPNKVLPGERCALHIDVTFKVGDMPLIGGRDETLALVSETFTVVDSA